MTVKFDTTGLSAEPRESYLQAREVSPDTILHFIEAWRYMCEETNRAYESGDIERMTVDEQRDWLFAVASTSWVATMDGAVNSANAGEIIPRAMRVEPRMGCLLYTSPSPRDS